MYLNKTAQLKFIAYTNMYCMHNLITSTFAHISLLKSTYTNTNIIILRYAQKLTSSQLSVLHVVKTEN